ncbi:MAG: carboxypeptidase-like regulatory domain-containing protein [Rikenellaceae bacterium]
MNKYTLLLILSLLLSLPLSAKDGGGFTLSGTVRNLETKKSVVGASIIVEDSYLWAVSDKNGDFHIDNLESGEYQLTIIYL